MSAGALLPRAWPDRPSDWLQTLAICATASRHCHSEFLFIHVEYYGDDIQATGWAMEHLRRFFAHAWLKFTARGCPEPDIPESTWIAESRHRHQFFQLQEDYRIVVNNNTPAEQFPGWNDAG